MQVKNFYEEALLCLEKYPCDEKKALQCLEKVLELDQNHLDALSHIGELLCNASDGQVRDPQRGIEYLKLFLSLEPNQVPECYFHLAQALAMEPTHALNAVHYYRLGISKLLEKLPFQKGKKNVHAFMG
jgi:tetratricopeptide (TPR) repeat protein